MIYSYPARKHTRVEIKPDGVLYTYGNGDLRFVPRDHFYSSAWPSLWHYDEHDQPYMLAYPSELMPSKEHKPMSNTFAQVSEDTNASSPSVKLELRTSSYSSSSVTIAVDASGATVNGVRLDVRDANSMLDGLRHFVRGSERVAKWAQKARDAADL